MQKKLSDHGGVHFTRVPLLGDRTVTVDTKAKINSVLIILLKVKFVGNAFATGFWIGSSFVLDIQKSSINQSPITLVRSQQN